MGEKIIDSDSSGPLILTGAELESGKTAGDSKMLNKEELNWINDYHQRVFEKISGFVTLEEKNWLLDVTKPL